MGTDHGSKYILHLIFVEHLVALLVDRAVFGVQGVHGVQKDLQVLVVLLVIIAGLNLLIFGDEDCAGALDEVVFVRPGLVSWTCGHSFTDLAPSLPCVKVKRSFTSLEVR